MAQEATDGRDVGPVEGYLNAIWPQGRVDGLGGNSNKIAFRRCAGQNESMFGQRRVRASWLLLVLFTSMSLGVCAATAFGEQLPCCEDLADGRAHFTTCCTVGKSSSLDFSVGIQAPVPPVSEVVFEVAPTTSCDAPSRRDAFSNLPYRSGDPQAFLSVFLI
jgi:hypothetical protein